MSRLRAHIRKLGGAAATHELYAIGTTLDQLRIAVRLHEIRRIRQGWYIDPDTPAAVADALRVGGRATCMTAVELHGLWTMTTTGAVHVAVPPNACQLRAPGDYRRRLGDAHSDAVVHWNDERTGGSRLAVSIPHALLDLAGCSGLEAAFVAAESALARGLMSRGEWAEACARAPAAVRIVLGRAGAASGSITESTFSFRIRGAGLRIRTQVQIGADRVDFVIGERLVVEVDGREFHERERDYDRDARLSARGYRVIRFSYRQVMFEWAAVEASLLAAVARGDAA
jgi:very-short-patch-repair endonuclease